MLVSSTALPVVLVVVVQLGRLRLQERPRVPIVLQVFTQQAMLPHVPNALLAVTAPRLW